MSRLPAYLLAGGDSSRFGSDKARADLSGRPVLVTLAGALMPATASLTVVARLPGEYEDLGLRTIGDDVPGLGPLGGLLTALRDRRERAGPGWLFLLACDVVDFRPEWLPPLLERAGKAIPAVAYRTERWHPLAALYHTSIEPEARRRGESDVRSVWRLLEDVGAVAVPFPGGGSGPRQINTPGDLAGYEAEA